MGNFECILKSKGEFVVKITFKMYFDFFYKKKSFKLLLN